MTQPQPRHFVHCYVYDGFDCTCSIPAGTYDGDRPGPEESQPEADCSNCSNCNAVDRSTCPTCSCTPALPAQPIDLPAIQARTDAATPGPWWAAFVAAARTDVPALLARVRELEAERALYVGVEPTIAEEMAELNRRLDAVESLLPADPAEDINASWIPPHRIRGVLSGPTPAAETVANDRPSGPQTPA
ncbi:hypothetical protein [Kitasatospora sp. NPDC087315]|uniref:hypothetical protein n=1 Tax=Kitasatospora sp. NPDC087315 TaxID=3364069 RepID=UPI0037FA7554